MSKCDSGYPRLVVPGSHVKCCDDFPHKGQFPVEIWRPDTVGGVEYEHHIRRLTAALWVIKIISLSEFGFRKYIDVHLPKLLTVQLFFCEYFEKYWSDCNKTWNVIEMIYMYMFSLKGRKTSGKSDDRFLN